jgi:hypothetical protein
MMEPDEFRARPLVAFPSKGTDLEAKGILVLGWLFRRRYPLLSLGHARSVGGTMTARKHLKRRVRARAAQTGESYTAALRYVRHHCQEVSVSDVDVADEPIFASCSFCKKNNRQVKKLVAGPGVYICNECLGLCDQLIEEEVTPEDSAKLQAQFLNRAADDVLAMLPALARTAEEVETELRRWVIRLRQLDTGWDEIAAVLQLSDEEVRQRFDRSPIQTNASDAAVSTTPSNRGSTPPSPPPE